MPEHITASPLTWPDGWKRTKTKVRSQFKSPSIATATRFVIEELGRMGIGDWNIIISTDLKLRQDGLPYSSQKTPEDIGASVWWKDKNDVRRVIALDKYDRIADNIHAIGKTIEAMRGIERWGSGEILERTFTGFDALPGPDHVIARSWRDVLDYYGDDLKEAEKVYRKARMDAHPDQGGSESAFHEVTQAWEQAQTEL
ncbi:MAG: J domain-containing protein [Candidatus Aminicenantes bacterium]|nr:J domain-containing protein [Candidatus Aminicenantes bacterium]